MHSSTMLSEYDNYYKVDLFHDNLKYICIGTGVRAYFALPEFYKK